MCWIGGRHRYRRQRQLFTPEQAQGAKNAPAMLQVLSIAHRLEADRDRTPFPSLHIAGIEKLHA